MRKPQCADRRVNLGQRRPRRCPDDAGVDRLGRPIFAAIEPQRATTGLGQMIFRAADFSRTDIIVAGCLIIGVIAMAMDRWLLLPIERRTVQRWGMVSRSEGGRP